MVLKNVLLGFFEDGAEDPQINFEQPPLDATSEGQYAHGGWTLVIQYFKHRRFLQALQLNKYLVVHVDLDVADEYGVPGVRDGRRLSLEERIADVMAMFRDLIGAEVMSTHGQCFLFAIGADSIECWLLPLLFDASKKAKRSKTTGCLDAANRELRKAGKGPLSKADGAGKNPDAYRTLSGEFIKRKVLLKHCDANPGLSSFVEQLGSVVLPADTA